MLTIAAMTTYRMLDRTFQKETAQGQLFSDVKL